MLIASQAAIKDEATAAKKAASKFEVYQDKAGEYRFRLKAANGETVAVSEGYSTKAA